MSNPCFYCSIKGKLRSYKTVMAISQTTNTLLWSRSRGLCNLCKTDLARKIGGDPILTGFRAHITADKPNGPRFDVELTGEERGSYSNLMLLCGDCHTKIDKAPNHYTVAKLHIIKTNHEKECIERLTIDDERRLISCEILANSVDLMVEGLSLERWDEWAKQILGPSPYRWPVWAMKEFQHWLRPAIDGVLWPEEAKALEISSKMSVDAISALQLVFIEKTPSHYFKESEFFACDSIEIMLSEFRGYDYSEYEKRLMLWDERLELGLVHLSKCVNFFADAVRERVNPRFRIMDGYFIIEPSRFALSNGVNLFSDTEKRKILESGYSPDRKMLSTVGLVAYTWENPPDVRDKEDYIM